MAAFVRSLSTRCDYTPISRYNKGRLSIDFGFICYSHRFSPIDLTTDFVLSCVGGLTCLTISKYVRTCTIQKGAAFPSFGHFGGRYL